MTSSSRKIFRKVKARRVGAKSQLINYTGAYHGQPMAKKMQLLEWIADHTEGRFYLDFKKIYFEKESDAIIFNLGFKI